MKKRLFSLALVIALMMTMFALTTTASAYYEVFSHCSNGKPLNVRSGPGKTYEVVDKIPYGDPIYVVGETYPGWLQLNDGEYYVQAALTCSTYPGPYVPKPVDPTQKEDGTADYNSIFATARQVTPYYITLKATQNSKGVANVRWAPSKKATLLRALPAGTQVQVFAEMRNWYQIYDVSTNSVGFVNTAYVN